MGNVIAKKRLCFLCLLKDEYSKIISYHVVGINKTSTVYTPNLSENQSNTLTSCIILSIFL